MPAPTLSPEEDALLRFALEHAWVHSKGVHKTQFDRKVQGESADHLQKLVEQGFLRSTGIAEYLPTVHGQLYVPAFSNDALADVFDFGKRLLDSDNPNKTVEADDLAKAVAPVSMSALDDPRIRFWFDCSLYGLEPYINVVRASPEGRPLAVYFAPTLLSLRTAAELLAKIDADRAAAEQRAATKPNTPREDKRKRAPRQHTVIHINGPVGALQTGDQSTANVSQNVQSLDSKRQTASEIAALIQEAVKNAGDEKTVFERFAPALARLEKEVNDTKLDVQFIADLVGDEFVAKQLPMARYGPAVLKLMEVVPGVAGKVLAAFARLFIKG